MTDIELIRLVLRENDPHAFDNLMQRYSLQVYNAALRLMKDEEDAAEVTQLAFIQAYKQLDSWRGGNFGAWVTIIANHIALRLLEKEKRRQKVPLDENIDPPNEEYDEQREQRLQDLERAITQLPEADQQIIRWHRRTVLASNRTAARTNGKQYQSAAFPHQRKTEEESEK